MIKKGWKEISGVGGIWEEGGSNGVSEVAVGASAQSSGGRT